MASDSQPLSCVEAVTSLGRRQKYKSQMKTGFNGMRVMVSDIDWLSELQGYHSSLDFAPILQIVRSHVLNFGGSDKLLEIGRRLLADSSEPYRFCALLDVLADATEFTPSPSEIDRYFQHIEDREVELHDWQRTIENFFYRGLRYEDFLKAIRDRVSDTNDGDCTVTHILTWLHTFDFSLLARCISPDFAATVQLSRRIRERSFVIAQLISIVHPSMGSLADIVHYQPCPHKEGAALGWKWRKPEDVQQLLDQGIVNSTEAEALVEIGKRLMRGQESNTVYTLIFERLFGDTDSLKVLIDLPPMP